MALKEGRRESMRLQADRREGMALQEERRNGMALQGEGEDDTVRREGDHTARRGKVWHCKQRERMPLHGERT